jgi:hypothetical protein
MREVISLAVVCLSIPWSIHSSRVTYVLSRTSTTPSFEVMSFLYRFAIPE